ncbi:MAG: DUF92 domain-containing protein [Methanolobus sp.]
MGGAFTKYKYGFKESIGLAQSKGGVRSYENVFSNSTAALVLAILYGIYPQHAELIIFAYLGTVATATGDTLASEVGTTARSQPIMITTLKKTHPGVDGAVTILGEVAALLGSMVIGILPVLFGKVDSALLAISIATAGGFIGTNIDGLLGATPAEKRSTYKQRCKFCCDICRCYSFRCTLHSFSVIFVTLISLPVFKILKYNIYLYKNKYWSYLVSMHKRTFG